MTNVNCKDVIPADVSLCCVVKSARVMQNTSIFSARGNVVHVLPGSLSSHR